MVRVPPRSTYCVRNDAPPATRYLKPRATPKFTKLAARFLGPVLGATRSPIAHSLGHGRGILVTECGNMYSASLYRAWHSSARWITVPDAPGSVVGRIRRVGVFTRAPHTPPLVTRLSAGVLGALQRIGSRVGA